MAKLQSLTTGELIAEYEAACAARYAKSHTTYRARQLRINRVVHVLSDRADNGDQIAMEWLDN